MNYIIIVRALTIAVAICGGLIAYGGLQIIQSHGNPVVASILVGIGFLVFVGGVASLLIFNVLVNRQGRSNDE